MPNLAGKVAVVTGASRGVGKGVAIALRKAGAKVYMTGRSLEPGIYPDGTVALRCDHRYDNQVDMVFEQVLHDNGKIDILVNNAWGGYETMVIDGEWTWAQPFWEQPVCRWESMFDAGVRACWYASKCAAPSMVSQRTGLIVNISFWAAQKYLGNAIYGAAKACTDKLTADMAHELEAHMVAVISLYPGLVRTEAVMQAADFLDLSNSESPEFVGRAVAHLASDSRIMSKSGKVLVTATVASEYGFADVDGRRPRPVTLDEA